MPVSKQRSRTSKRKVSDIDENVTNNDVTSKKNKIHEDDGNIYWLMKSEPESRFQNGIDMKFSFEDLKISENQTTCWDGVRNYEARNHLKSMKLSQKAFFYHSNCKNPGIIGIVEICKEAYVDHTQFDPKDPHYDPKSAKENPKWIMVDVKYERDLKRFISLAELKHYHLEHKSNNGDLKGLSLFTRSRLSVQPINQNEWDFIINLENQKQPDKLLK